MLTYIVRRVLYSIPVLVATSFLIFSAVSAIRDPLATLKLNPIFLVRGWDYLPVAWDPATVLPRLDTESQQGADRAYPTSSSGEF